MKKIKRSEFASFLKCGETYNRMGKGVTSQTINYNPQTTTEQYINEDNATTSVNAYQMATEQDHTCYADEPIFDYIDDLRKSHAIGGDLDTKILFVYIYDSTTSGSSTVYAAEECDCTIAIDSFGGEAGSDVKIGYAVHINGDPVIGTATITNGAVTFTAA